MKNNYFKNSIKLINNNFKTVMGFEIIYKLLVGLIIIPLSIAGFNVVMNLTGYTYLTSENIVSFLINAINILFILLMIIFITFISMIEISILIIIFDQSYHNNKITIKDATKTGIIRLFKLFKIKNIHLAFLVTFIILFLNLGVASSVITSIDIPQFITDYIINNKILFTVFMIFIIFLIVYLIHSIFAFHYMILESKDFTKARIASKNLIKNNVFKDLLKLLFSQILIYAIYLITVFLGVYIIVLINNILTSHMIIESILITIIWLFILIILFFTYISSNAVSYATISSLFYKHKVDNNRKIIEIDYYKSVNTKKTNKIFKVLINVIIIIIFMGGSILTYQVVNGNIDLTSAAHNDIEVTAHRGASHDYPENTMSAFIGAKNLDSDWIELDVHQTKDRKIIVMHDANFKRVANVNKKVSDLTYSEIGKIDVGSFFDPKFKDERAPLLEDVIKYAKENEIKLNIEIKPTGTETDFEKQVIDIINKNEFKDNCVVASINYVVLENTKKIDSSIRTLYVMPLAIGNIIDLKDADDYSIEASNINYNLVARIHNSGKKIFAWTINDEDTLRNMIDLNVDNIITDNVTQTKEIINSEQDINIINELIKTLLNV